ncbi:MAG: hypothetical protein WD876_01650 [Candidatus Pacearchaeota archaeon]
MTENRYGMGTKKEFGSEYRDRWVLIYSHGLNTTFSGKVSEVRSDGYVRLNPFQHIDIKEGKLVRGIIEDETGSLVPWMGSAIEPTTEEYLRAWCEMMNKKDGEKKSRWERLRQIFI